VTHNFDRDRLLVELATPADSFRTRRLLREPLLLLRPPHPLLPSLSLRRQWPDSAEVPLTNLTKTLSLLRHSEIPGGVAADHPCRRTLQQIESDSLVAAALRRNCCR
jgi:hypothetical protein